ncbi:MAG: hypothetical protein GTN86_05025 [Xanthomonadales bacterium]|nr:hypothetical protein [Xanthomonadales bacterium]NIN59335.1 hypothetical protein [Xanthomonadales bacterium]NIN74686.1 hypothetical protein [Xanthomonadales bacterium]NIO12586.1 hypothetical protein [Xanthomonadales bacterium]NIP11728.1 hypothetical protein [Xanthomonadales bacterium]
MSLTAPLQAWRIRRPAHRPQDRIIRIPVVLDEVHPATFENRADGELGRRQVRRLEGWLGRPLPAGR